MSNLNTFKESFSPYPISLLNCLSAQKVSIRINKRKKMEQLNMISKPSKTSEKEMTHQGLKVTKDSTHDKPEKILKL